MTDIKKLLNKVENYSNEKLHQIFVENYNKKEIFTCRIIVQELLKRNDNALFDIAYDSKNYDMIADVVSVGMFTQRCTVDRFLAEIIDNNDTLMYKIVIQNIDIKKLDEKICIPSAICALKTYNNEYFFIDLFTNNIPLTVFTVEQGIKFHCLELVKALCKKWNLYSPSILEYAAKYRFYKLFVYLIRKKNVHYNEMCLKLAMFNNAHDIVEYLIKGKGVKVYLTPAELKMIDDDTKRILRVYGNLTNNL